MGDAMRRWLSFDVDGARCAATLDDGAGSNGLLIVSGGNETRAGAHRGMAWLAAEVASAGYPVLRCDRRGVGDSDGDNNGFESSAADIAGAVALFRAQCPQLAHITAFGNCDAAAALLLHAPAGIDAMLCANPWTIDEVSGGSVTTEAAPTPLPPAAIRARYLAKLTNPREIWRLLSGGVNLSKLLRGLNAARMADQAAPPGSLAARMRQAMGRIDAPVTFLLARRDATAMAFLNHWTTTFDAERDNFVLETLDSGSHGFADDAARAWLRERVLAALGTAR